MEHSEYEYQTHFDKKKAVELADKILAGLRTAGIVAELWRIQPWLLAFHVEPQRPNLTEIVAGLYGMPEVLSCDQSVEPNTRVRILTVQLEPRWFMVEQGRDNAAQNASRRRRHPEDEAASA